MAQQGDGKGGEGEQVYAGLVREGGGGGKEAVDLGR